MRHPKCVCTRFQPNPALHHHQALMAVQSILGLRKTTRILSTSNPKIFKAMRKSFIYAAGLICLALTLTNCQKESIQQESPASETNFELFAHPVTTKTANEGLETKWVAKDSINVFHAEAGATTYVSDGKFIVKNTETGSFDGTIKTLDASKSYDWYAFYPYSSYNKTPAGVSKATFGYTTIGGKSQTQTSNNSRAHLSGKACPLYGIASNVAYDKPPSIAMNHLTSVIKVAVTNNSGEDLTVSSVSFTGTEDIVGTYYINFADSPIAYASTGDKYVSSTASLSVSKGEAIANGSSADFYIAIKPFTAKSGSTLKLAVNGYEKTITLDKDITFTAGHIKPLNFNYDKVTSVSGKQITVTFDGGAGQKDGLTWTPAPLTIVANKGDKGSNAPNEHAKDKELRFYAGNTITISGATITKVEFTGTVKKFSADSGTMASDNKSWTGNTNKLTITNSDSSQAKFKSITITYQE